MALVGKHPRNCCCPSFLFLGKEINYLIVTQACLSNYQLTTEQKGTKFGMEKPAKQN